MRLRRWWFAFGAAFPGAVLLQLGGCLGPNPGFFISTSVANATIMNLVSAFLRNALALGGE